MTPLCNVAHIHGRTGWKARPLTLADLLSNLVSMVEEQEYVGDGGVAGLLLLLFLAGARGKLQSKYQPQNTKRILYHTIRYRK